MLEVKLTKTNDNPFFGLRHTLVLYQNAGKGSITDSMLNQSWNEVKGDKTKRELFFALLFSIGDITARQHNIFGKNKIDSGGNAQREAFNTIMDWMVINHLAQFEKFLQAHLFSEYTSFDSLLANRIITKKKTKQVTTVKARLSGSKDYINILTSYIAGIIKGNNPAHKYFVAKFLTRPRVSKRKGHKLMLPSTKKNMRQREFFLKLVSLKAGLRFVRKETHIEFIGYYEWRKDYIGNLESVLFSSKKILEFDKQEFLKWLGGLPASARFRVRTRLLTKDNQLKKANITGKDREVAVAPKWGLLAEWFLEWEKFKDTKQTEVRVIEEKIRQGDESVETKQKLAKVQEEAKVTTGAVNFQGMFNEIVLGTIDKLKVQPFLDKINLPYNTLVFSDDSSSMMQKYGLGKDQGFTAFDFSAFLTTVMLTKNPDDSGRSLVGLFSSSTRMFTTMNSTSRFVNSLTRSSKTSTVSEALIKPELHFLDNLTRMRSFFHSLRTGNGTNISSIPEYLYRWMNESDGWSTKDEKVEQLQQFPVWTIITDGNWNQMSSPEGSMNDFMMKCQRYFGYKPYIIAIDAAGYTSANIERFQGIENFMYITPNPAQIEQLLTNFKDMDIMDIYTPLQSLYRSNRYDLVKAFTI